MDLKKKICVFLCFIDFDANPNEIIPICKFIVLTQPMAYIFLCSTFAVNSGSTDMSLLPGVTA